ncbi:hypothetical protein GCM10010518_31000 [Kitasatospora cinereorecta]
MAEQGEPGSAVHLSHDPFGSGVDALGAAVVVGAGEAGVDGGTVEFEAVREGMQVGQVGGANGGDPVGELGVVARDGIAQCAYWPGNVTHGAKR